MITVRGSSIARSLSKGDCCSFLINVRHIGESHTAPYWRQPDEGANYPWMTYISAATLASTENTDRTIIYVERNIVFAALIPNHLIAKHRILEDRIRRQTKLLILGDLWITNPRDDLSQFEINDYKHYRLSLFEEETLGRYVPIFGDPESIDDNCEFPVQSFSVFDTIHLT